MIKKILVTSIFCNVAFGYNLSICKVEEHEAINSVEKGIRDELKDDDIEIRSETCQNNPALATQIISKFVNSKSDVIVTIGTTPTLSSVTFAERGKAKVVFSSVTDPRSVNNKKNITGVSNFIPIKPQLELFKEIQPNLKKLGIIYNSGEINSSYIVNEIKKVAKDLGIDIVDQCIQRSSELPQALNKLFSKEIDAIFISNDNMVLSAIPYIVKKCLGFKIPVYVSDTDQVEKGCFAALGPNQYQIGVQTAKVIKRIKNGEDINKIDFQFPSTSELFINKAIAHKLKIEIPQNVLDKCTKALGE